MSIDHTQNFTRQPLVAVVDDEELVTRSIKSFLEMETPYRILTYQNPAEALEELSLQRPDVVIADFLMPEMNGLEFLAAMREHYPEVPRILLTGYADKENAIRGINEVGLFQYIQKPWDNDHLKLTIMNGLANKDLQITLKEKIRELDLILGQRDELFKVNNVMQEELTFAKRIHKQFMGSGSLASGKISVKSLYRPAFEIGGDFYDIIPLADDRLAVILLDLTGHGIQAALCTALAKFAVSGLRGMDVTAMEIIYTINDVMHRGLPKELFAATLVVVCDTRTGECELVNAGIPYPLWLKRGQGVVEKLNLNGMLLGMMDNKHYMPGKPHRVTLEKGEGLFLYTDGLMDVENNSGQYRETNDIRDSLNELLDMDQEAISRKLMDITLNFNDGDQPLDDITIVTIDRK